MLLATYCAHAQSLQEGAYSYRIKQCLATDTISLDTLSIVPGSIKILNDSNRMFQFLPEKKVIVLNKPNANDSLSIKYSVFAIDFQKVYARKKIEEVSTYMGSESIRFTDNVSNNKIGLLNMGEMDYNGSLSRGLSFGNNQDVVLNSQFNLQMSGYIGDSIFVLGSLTDNNIPIQPEGNSQNIQEFDKVYMELTKNKTKIKVGDYDLLRPKSYFMNFYKRVQGIYAGNETIFSKNRKYTYGAGVSLAKGKFVRQVVMPIEGNQGPYKLIGPNGETFFIVLANSDKVYIDGLLLQRGEDKDYIIDYNQAEVIFMPRKMITKDSRIIIEYEFNDRYYLNSLIYTNHEIKWSKKHQMHLFAYSNQDARNQSNVAQDLSNLQKTFLTTIGDNINDAKVNSARLDTFSTNRVMYKLVDSMLQGIIYDSIYVYSTNKDSARYSIAFTYVGEGKGHYTPSANLANGRVYQWLAPVNNKLLGSYEPFVTLVTPKRIQMLSMGGTYIIDSGKTLTYEVALSNNDPNLFSKINNENHLGIATRIGLQQYYNIYKAKSIGLQTNVQYEFVQHKFSAIERFRTTEFNRDWNVAFEPQPANEHIGTLNLSLAKENKWSLMYNFNIYNRANLLQSYKNEIGLKAGQNNRTMEAIINVTNGKGQLQTMQYIRPSMQVEQTIPKLNKMIVGAKCSLENNQIKFTPQDSLLNNSFYFGVAKAYLRSAAEAKHNFEVDYFVREDKLPSGNKLKDATLSHNFNATTSFKLTANQSLAINTGYRKLIVKDSTLYSPNVVADNTLLSRLQYDATLFKKSLQYNLLYELGNGRELRRAFTYIEVPQGQGIYAWRDYNSDNVQQLNEFEVAIYQDEKKYIRVFTPTNQYLLAKYNLLNMAINFQPKLLLVSRKNKWAKFISRFNLQTSVGLNNKLINDNSIRQYNPFSISNSDTGIISKNTAINNTIYFNRFSNIWGAEIATLYNENKALLTYGIDTRNTIEHQLRTRFNFHKQWMMNVNYKQGYRNFLSPFLSGRSYNYTFKSIQPAITYLSKKGKFRTVLDGRYEQRLNEAKYGGEKTFVSAANIETKYNLANSNSVLARFTYNQTIYTGVSNSSIGYILLDGLQPGNNFLWQFNFDKKISSGIEIGVEYEGRKAAINPVVHIGRVVARAVF